MLQIFQYQKTGELIVDELPEPTLRPDGVLVRNHFSLISAGTERTSVETAQASLLGKAKKRPDLVKQVRDNLRREGLVATWNKVRTRLDNYAALGYSSAGIVIESAVDDFKPGDRVACAGTGYASHAEVVFVPRNLVARVPEPVALEEAAYTTLGAVALQGVRQAEPRIGEQIVVIGLGLIGLLTVQLLKANGCRVMGLDVRPDSFPLAAKLGCDNCTLSNTAALSAIEHFTRGIGADAVILTASTRANDPIELALQAARKKGRIVIVGAVGMNLPRSPFYEKELEVRISCSYGPGRYDPNYEERGVDYPLPYVRWTENRNMQAFLDLLAEKRIDVRSLTTHVFPIREAVKAYDLITNKNQEPSLGILIAYPQESRPRRTRVDLPTVKPLAAPRIGFIGAGNFAQAYLLPPLVRLGASLSGVFTANPIEAKSVAKKYGFSFCAGDAQEVFRESDAVVIATRHDSHADYVVAALESGLHVYVEKPPAVTPEQLQAIIRAYRQHAEPAGRTFTVGYNRRFSPIMRRIKAFFQPKSGPLQIFIRINAGFLPKDHWTQLPEQGGRLIGEACHFIDIMSYLTDSRPQSVYAESLSHENVQTTQADNVVLLVKFDDGSVGTLIYTASGDKALAKEYYEIHAGGRSAVLHDFRKAEFFEDGRKRKLGCRGKGHAEEMAAFLKLLHEGVAEFTFESLIDTSLVTFAAHRSLALKKPQEVIWPSE
ncbi:MAG: bi-domain-containing oxidoreductase [candidate division KSB1 bacterium]|nr:bi-domain-containing oxidoreductase [candidate division KSB1 bacterium]